MNYLRRIKLIVISVYLTSCATTRYQPEFKDSNQLFLEETVNNIHIEKYLNRLIPSGSSIALLSIEVPNSIDIPIIATIEDQLIYQMVRKGFNVLERDQNTIKNLIEEKSNENYSVLSQSKIQKYSEEDTTFIRLYKTNLDQAKYIITYRILEFGIIYRENKDVKLTDREGIVRLHIRIVDTNTGKIILAGNIGGKKEDTIKTKIVDKLANFHYSYFSHNYPLQIYDFYKKEGIIQFYNPIKEGGKKKNKDSFKNNIQPIIY